MLTIRKLSYSRLPWRIGVAQADGRFLEVPDAGFARKKDAVPVLQALQRVADWDIPWMCWGEAEREDVAVILAQTPMAREWRAVMTSEKEMQ